MPSTSSHSHNSSSSDSESELDFPSSVQSDHSTTPSSSSNLPSDPTPKPTTVVPDGMHDVMEAVVSLRTFVAQEMASLKEEMTKKMGEDLEAMAAQMKIDSDAQALKTNKELSAVKALVEKISSESVPSDHVSASPESEHYSYVGRAAAVEADQKLLSKYLGTTAYEIRDSRVFFWLVPDWKDLKGKYTSSSEFVCGDSKWCLDVDRRTETVGLYLTCLGQLPKYFTRCAEWSFILSNSEDPSITLVTGPLQRRFMDGSIWGRPAAAVASSLVLRKPGDAQPLVQKNSLAITVVIRVFSYSNEDLFLDELVASEKEKAEKEKKKAEEEKKEE